MNMETNYQFKSATKKFSRKLTNWLLDNITDAHPDQIICNKIGQVSTSEFFCRTQDVYHQQVILLYQQRAILLYLHHQKNRKNKMIIII